MLGGVLIELPWNTRSLLPSAFLLCDAVGYIRIGDRYVKNLPFCREREAFFFMPRRWFHGSSPGIWDCGGLRSFCPAVCPCSLLFGAFPFFPCLFPLFPLLLHSLPAAPSTCFSEPQDPWCQRSLLFLICALFCSPDFFRHGVQTCGSRADVGCFLLRKMRCLSMVAQKKV